MSEYTADTIARITLAVLTKPGDPVTGQLVQAIGVTETLALIRDPGAAIPSQVDPVAGVRWRQQAAAQQKDALTDELIGLTERHGLRILTPHRPGWPDALTDLGHTAPLALWAKGNPELLTSSLTSRVTITGARAATGYGVQVTREFASQLAASPRILVSGGAYGIDAEAHRAALAARLASTIAVLAGGLDRPYPRAHHDLFRRVTEHGGLLVSEAAPGFAPTKGRFEARARLLAALSAATVIPEAGARSGSLRVAVAAYELGRLPPAPRRRARRGRHERRRCRSDARPDAGGVPPSAGISAGRAPRRPRPRPRRGPARALNPLACIAAAPVAPFLACFFRPAGISCLGSFSTSPSCEGDPVCRSVIVRSPLTRLRW